MLKGTLPAVKAKMDKPARDAGGGTAAASPFPWSEVLDETDQPRASYGPLLQRLSALPRAELRLLDQRMEATMRELGVSFDLAKGSAFGQKPWSCDVLPHVFSGEEWSLVVRGLRQRMRAFEMFLHDVYGEQEILRRGVIPIAPVLGSPHFQSAPRPACARPAGATCTWAPFV